HECAKQPFNRMSQGSIDLPRFCRKIRIAQPCAEKLLEGGGTRPKHGSCREQRKLLSHNRHTQPFCECRTHREVRAPGYLAAQGVVVLREQHPHVVVAREEIEYFDDHTSCTNQPPEQLASPICLCTVVWTALRMDMQH